MKIANLIVTYTDPHLTERMIKKLGVENFDYYIHVDKKKDIQAYQYLTQYPNVFLVSERIDVRWAGYNTVKAIFSCVKAALKSGRTYDYLNLLSGQDYPIKSSAYIIDFLQRNKGRQFIEYLDIDSEWTEAQIRVTHYDFVNYKMLGKHKLKKIVNKIFPNRKMPDNMKPYGRGMYWVLTPDRAKYVVDRIEGSKALTRFFAYTWGGDELIFQTLLLNSPYKNELINDDLHYVDFSAGGSHPKNLDVEDFEKLRDSADLFGRKFSPTGEGKIFDLLDQL